MFLPRTLSTIDDPRNALARLSLVFRMPLREGAPFVVDLEQEAAVWVKGDGWVWEEAKGKKEKEGGEMEKQNENEEEHAHKANEQPPFAPHDFTLSIPRGMLAAVVRRVGSGKLSLLQGLIGEMRFSDMGGEVFGGSVAYCLQSAWIQNAILVSASVQLESRALSTDL
jgi:ABC-type transport system involved in cytochrome bd biosynthesis fused ATPase/permease subunit